MRNRKSKTDRQCNGSPYTNYTEKVCIKVNHICEFPLEKEHR